MIICDDREAMQVVKKVVGDSVIRRRKPKVRSSLSPRALLEFFSGVL